MVPNLTRGNPLKSLIILFPFGGYRESVLIYSVISSDKQNANGRIVHL